MTCQSYLELEFANKSRSFTDWDPMRAISGGFSLVYQHPLPMFVVHLADLTHNARGKSEDCTRRVSAYRNSITDGPIKQAGGDSDMYVNCALWKLHRFVI